MIARTVCFKIQMAYNIQVNYYLQIQLDFIYIFKHFNVFLITSNETLLA